MPGFGHDNCRACPARLLLRWPGTPGTRRPHDLDTVPPDLVSGLGAWAGELELSIGGSQLSVTCRSREDVSDLATLRNLITQTAQGVVDALGYSWGQAYQVEITSVTGAGGHLFFGTGIPELEASQPERPLQVEAVVAAALTNNWFRRALGELRQAIQTPGDTGFHCKRATEAVRRHFQPDQGAKHDAWEAMRQALRIQATTLKTLNEFGDRQRHGDIPFMSEEERIRDMRLTWQVVDRFAVLLHRAVPALPDDEFPLL